MKLAFEGFLVSAALTALLLASVPVVGQTEPCSGMTWQDWAPCAVSRGCNRANDCAAEITSTEGDGLKDAGNPGDNTCETNEEFDCGDRTDCAPDECDENACILGAKLGDLIDYECWDFGTCAPQT